LLLGDREDTQDATSRIRPVYMWTLVEETDQLWPRERFWHSPQGRHVRQFDAYPTLGKYLARIILYPLVIARQKQERRPAGIPWIFAELPVGSYSPNNALAALASILHSKINHYGGLSRPVRLLVYYGRAVAYNTPWHGLEFHDFQDVAEAAANVVGTQSRFDKIYLLSALEPGLEAFEIFPQFLKCQ